jgi:CHAT domain-containing protein
VAPAGQIRLADPNLLRRLESLPGALAELRALAGRYGERAEVMVEGGATEAAVKASAAIRSARYVVFSTHGLLAGQAGVPGEPGLVFTPPAGEASETDDGFLSASEVAQMRFAAELVVLSACNTAAGGGRYGGEGLSGLARAFFFAGARAILVSHWSVSDLATSELIAGAFGALDQDRTLSRGVAIQRAMQQVRADPRLRSPRYWAAFTLVGDPS